MREEREVFSKLILGMENEKVPWKIAFQMKKDYTSLIHLIEINHKNQRNYIVRYQEYIGKLEDTQTLQERIERLNRQISENNVALRFEPQESGMGILILEYEKKPKNQRNAGRKRKDVSGEHSSLWRISDVRASMKEIGYEETAKLLGCSRSTLYRRLRERGDKEDGLFY